ncbi:acyl-CoA N-acyltransferase [Clathrospora elynae]|uniref:Acyl-CoA N-acyltransferase n=1 Tax=Clathrospora elynae TaxID=706981 RepID=A0A6A5SL51_9PLEO|nr:acyl-CoA N-acyltransferase [Clathrospora elynae]
MPPTGAEVKTRPAVFPNDREVVGQLFLAYAQSLPISLDFQNFEHELAGLPGKYAVDNGGAVWLAYRAQATQPSTANLNLPRGTTSELVGTKEKDEQSIGCIAIRPFSANSTTLLESSTSKVTPTTKCELKRLYLTPDARGRGVSKLLMDVALQKARELGYKEMLLDTLSSMTAARTLYTRYGFEEIGSYYESVENAVFYRLVL